MAQKEFTKHTDSSKIETKYFPGGKEVREIVKNKNLIYYQFYRDNKKTITSTANYDTLGQLIGIAKEFNDKGKLIYTIDYTTGSWTVVNKKDYPYFDLQNKMKLLADNLIIKIYGKEFLKQNAIWNAGTSAIYNKNESGNWTDVFERKPTRFLFRYNVRFDKYRVYDDLIEFELDSNGTFIPNSSEAIFGFEKLPENNKHNFQLTYDNAIKIAKQKGLIETEKNKINSFLKWESFQKEELFCGQFRFYIIAQTGTIEDVKPKGRSSVTTKFDVYSFNPWTSAFIEKKKMKSIRSWEERSGSSTGLIPDK